MKKYIKGGSLAACALALTLTTAHAQTLGINFEANINSPGVPVDSATPAGVVPQLNFNNANPTGLAAGTNSSLIYADGSAATGVTLTWKANDTYSSGITPPSNNDAALMTDFLDGGPNNVSADVSVTGLPSGTYALFLYIAGDQSGAIRGGTYTINGNDFYLLNSGTDSGSPSGTFELAVAGDSATPGSGTAGNYFKTTFAGSSLTISESNFYASDPYPRAPIDGLQIVAVPEPSTLAMMALGGMGMLAMIRRRNS